ncbi:hypothetical protein EVAR_81021_1 [Eumeta japonica]|uniref:Uncharacterized protein n=1 Tax=Eumeta variegata TaxID=151549 RepID=A0A4C1T6B0_EUMVA|nr:hypothetical protein EVAR_81021_1 [Eumeta japonica]
MAQLVLEAGRPPRLEATDDRFHQCDDKARRRYSKHVAFDIGIDSLIKFPIVTQETGNAPLTLMGLRVSMGGIGDLLSGGSYIPNPIKSSQRNDTLAQAYVVAQAQSHSFMK